MNLIFMTTKSTDQNLIYQQGLVPDHHNKITGFDIGNGSGYWRDDFLKWDHANSEYVIPSTGWYKIEAESRIFRSNSIGGQGFCTAGLFTELTTPGGYTYQLQLWQMRSHLVYTKSTPFPNGAWDDSLIDIYPCGHKTLWLEAGTKVKLTAVAKSHVTGVTIAVGTVRFQIYKD